MRLDLLGILPCQVLNFATLYFALEPCLGMNGHLRARMKTILRQCEAEVKIFNSRWFPASIYRSKWSIIAGQGSNIEKSSKKLIFQHFFFDFPIDPGGPGGHPGRSRTDPGAEKHQKLQFFKFF